MSSILLKDRYPHIRDKSIRFQEKGHVYYVKREKGYKSVTTIVHNAFEKFNADKVIDNMMKSPKWPESKYYGMTKEAIKQSWKSNGTNASNMGTDMHAMFEYHYNKIHQDKIEKHNFDLNQSLKACWETKWELFIPNIVLYGIFGGHAKLVETAAFTVVYVFIIETFVYKDIKKKRKLSARVVKLLPSAS